MNFKPLSYYRQMMMLAFLVPNIIAVWVTSAYFFYQKEQLIQSRQTEFNQVLDEVESEFERLDHILSQLHANINTKTLQSAELSANWYTHLQKTPERFYWQRNADSGQLYGARAWQANDAQKVIAPLTQISSFELALAISRFSEAVFFKPSLNAIVYAKAPEDLSQEVLHQLARLPDAKSTDSGFFTQPLSAELPGEQFALLHHMPHQNGHVGVIFNLSRFNLWLASKTQGRFVITPKALELAHSDETLSRTVALTTKPWQLQYQESLGAITATALRESITAFVLFFTILSALFVFILTLTRRSFVSPTTQLIARFEAKSDEHQDYQPPEAWQHTFKQTDTVLAERRAFLTELQNQNAALDAQVQQKTQELKGSIAAKERNLGLLNAILNNLPDLVYFKNIDGSFLGCNKAFEDTLGMKAIELVGKQSDDVIPHSSGLNFTDIERSVMADKSQVTETVEQYRMGQYFAYQLQVMPFYSDDESLLGVMGIARDITEAERANMALKASELKFRSAIEYASNGILLLNKHAQIVQLNRAARKIFHLDKNYVFGEPLSYITSEPHLSELTRRLEAIQQDKNSVQKVQFLFSPNVWLSISMAAVWDDVGEIVYYVLHVNDISELMLEKERALRATKAKSRFIANIGHEVRTPLNAVMGMLKMLLETPLNQQQSQFGEKALHAADALLMMLNNVLDFAKAEAGESTLVKAPFRLTELVDECIDVVEPLLIEKPVTFTLDVDAKIAQVYSSDKLKIKQVLANILSNAAKFTHEGSVSLSVSETAKNTLVFKVKDTGIGIDAKHLPKLFDAFSQGDESNTRNYEGVGLGLAISKQLSDMLDGRIDVISSPNQGSEFTFTLSLSPEPEDGVRLPSEITVLDRHKTLAEPLKALFEQLGVQEFKFIDKPYFKDVPPLLLVTDVLALGVLTPDVVQKLNQSQCQVWLLDRSKKVHPSMYASLDVTSLPDHLYPQRLLDTWQGHHRETVTSKALNLQRLKDKVVMLVDDNDINQQIGYHLLAQAGCQIIQVYDGEQALAVCQDFMPDIILMDLQMPKMDGFSAAKAIQKIKGHSKATMVALTAHTNEEDILACVRAGMQAHIAKPIKALTFYRTLVDNLDLEKAQLEDAPWLKECYFDEAFAKEQVFENPLQLKKMLSRLLAYCEQGIDEHNTMAMNFIEMAHNIKGSAGNLGFNRLAHAAKVVDQHNKEEKLSSYVYACYQQQLTYACYLIKHILGKLGSEAESHIDCG